MGKRGGEKVKKRKKVTVQLLKRMHAGEVTEPYKIMEELVAKKRADMKDLKLAIAWRIGWRPDANNILTLGRCRKRGDLDRELDSFDFVILLNREAWGTLGAKEKQALIYHELCHAQVTYDSDGNPKRDDRDRIVCRTRKHDLEEFRAVVEEYGCYTRDLAAVAQAAINDANRPLLAEAAKNGQAVAAAPGDPDVDDSWKKLSLAAAAFKANHQDAMEAAGLQTLGDLQGKMNQHGQFWTREIGMTGRFRIAIEDCFNRYLNGIQKAAKKAAKDATKDAAATV
jgi:hypothetical protein